MRTFACAVALVLCLGAAGRAGANSITLIAVDDGYAQDLGSGVFGSLNTTNSLMWAYAYAGSWGYNEQRFALEFDLSSIPSGATINSATLSLTRTGGGAGAGGDSTFDIWIHGYSGDGSIALGDMSISNPIAGPFVYSYISGSFVSTDISADVSTYLQSLVDASATHAGFMGAVAAPFPAVSLSVGFATRESSTLCPPGNRCPMLIVDYVPEPSTVVLLATGLAGLAAAGRRRPLR